MLYDEDYIRCRICFALPSAEFGPPVTLGSVAREIVFGAIGEACDLIGTLIGGSAAHGAEEREKQRKEVEKATKKFDRFLKKVPQLRAEQERLADEERQKAALEAKARQEELRLLKKQATTAAGLKRMKPTNFELAVASLYLKLGYNVYLTPTSSDRGIDLVAIKDKERIAVQCKRYKRTVPVSQVRDFYGSFVGTYNRGVFVTSSTFSEATREWAEERQGLELVNGQQLAKLFVEQDPKIVSNVEKWKDHPGGKE
jgi:restriction system protein